jgi:ubiquinone/menaquinone biosynthesis C-methylase UbiE
VGCGTGGLAIAAAARVGPTGKVHGVDASPEMVVRGRHRATRVGVPIVLEVAPVEALPFPDRTFDILLSSLMLHHLPPMRHVTPRASPRWRRSAVDGSGIASRLTSTSW